MTTRTMKLKKSKKKDQIKKLSEFCEKHDWIALLFYS